MASVSGSRSGGKILRSRRRAAAGTPYDRPAPSASHSQQQPRSPNWLSRFVLSPTRFVASGAGKLFSAVLDLDSSSPTSSSSDNSSPSSPDASSSSEEVGAYNDESDKPVEVDDALNKGGSSELINFFVKGLQPLGGNNKSKHLIEQLVMQESFSREEGDRLIKIIRSRIVDSPAKDNDGDKRSRGMLNRTLGSDADSPDLCSAAVLEAKKWLQEKKSGLDSNSDLGYGSRSLHLVTLPQASKDEGSPVDVAKSYMRARPPWASPSMDHIKSPTPVGIQLFKDETPHLFGGNSTSSSKLKRDSPATGSWSIQDEIRRVRSRATEEMLRTVPSSKVDLSAFAMEYKNNVHTSAIENIEASCGEKIHSIANLAYAPSNLTRGFGTQASSDLENKQDGFQPESVLSDPVNSNTEQNQGIGAVQQTKGSQDDCREVTAPGKRDGSLNDMHRDGGLVNIGGINDTNGDNHHLDSVEENTDALKLRLQDGNCSVINEMVGAEAALANGNSGPSFHAEQVVEQNTETLDNEPSTVDSGQERTTKGVLEQEKCNLLGESMEVPDATVNNTVAFKEDEGVVNASQNSSSIQFEVQQDNNLPGSEPESAATPTSIAKQKGKRVSRYNRRGRSSRGVK